MRGSGLSLVGLLLLPACAPMPKLGPAPAIAPVSHFAAERTLASPASPAARPTAAADWPAGAWWQAYGDAQLDALIAEALAEAPDLAAAAARLRAAEAAAQVSGAARLPTLDAEGSAGVAKQSYHNGIPADFVPHGWKNTGRVAADFNFDLDLWGANRAAYRAALSDAEVARLERQQAALILSTNIADAYADLARLFAERQVQLAALEIRSQTAALTADRVTTGLDTQAELKQASSAVPAARADLAATDEQIGLTRNRLAALLGKGPDRGLAIAAPRAIVPARGLPADVTTDLIGRRPDVIAARMRVEAAASRIKVARAAFYPAVNLSAAIGFQSLGFANLLKGGSVFGNAGPALSLPIFHGGEIQGRYRGARADYDEAVANYDRAVADAFHEVADAVVSRNALATRLAESQQALDDAQAAYAIARQRYQGGLSTFLDELTAQDRALQALRTVTDLKARAFTLDVALVRALGGGFAPPAASAAEQTSKDSDHG